jgi:hypothetical protein
VAWVTVLAEHAVVKQIGCSLSVAMKGRPLAISNPYLIPQILKMDPIDLRTLKILEKVDNDGTPSQRDIARDLNCDDRFSRNCFGKISGHGNIC